jgi:hypothetical protein
MRSGWHRLGVRFAHGGMRESAEATAREAGADTEAIGGTKADGGAAGSPGELRNAEAER